MEQSGGRSRVLCWELVGLVCFAGGDTSKKGKPRETKGNQGKTKENQGKTKENQGKPRKNQGETKEKPRKNQGKTKGKPTETNGNPFNQQKKYLPINGSIFNQ